MSETARRALALHQRILNGDPSAGAELFEEMLAHVEAYLVKRYSHPLDRLTLSDIATDALIAYINAPERFNPSKAGLSRYLTLIAEGNAKDALRRLSRRPQHFEEFVENLHSQANNTLEAQGTPGPPSLERLIDAMSILERHQSDICSDPGDAEVLELMLKGEKDMSAFVHALGLSEHAGADSRKSVVRKKDKIKRRLRRLKEKLDHG